MDKKISFIIKNGSYQEAPTSELVEDKKWKPEYQDRRFVKLHGYLMEVDDMPYRDFQRERRRQKYLAEEAELHNEFSYNSLDCSDYSGEDLIVDIVTNVECEVVRNMMRETVRNMVELLPENDLDLITSLYYLNMTVREYSEFTGIPTMTIQDRKARILKKMKKTLEK